MVKKGTIRGFDPATYTATIQLAGSLSVWLDNVPVSRAIPPCQMVAGRSCAVLLLDESHPQDAVVAAVFSTAESESSQPWEHIGTVVLESSAASVDFDQLSPDFTAFRLLALVRRSTFGGPISTGVRFNDDASQSYDLRDLIADASGVRTTLLQGGTYGVIGVFDDAHYGVAFVYIQASDPGVEKEWLSFAGLGSSSLRHITGRWNNTSSAVTKITVTPVIGELYAGSTFILEGIRR